MLPESPSNVQQRHLFDITDQLDQNHPLLALGRVLDWGALEQAFAPLYSAKGRNANPIRLMSGLLLIKQLYKLSDESVIEQWAMNPSYQVFCGESFQAGPPCHSTDLVKFRQRIGEKGVEQLFALSVWSSWCSGRRGNRVG